MNREDLKRIAEMRNNAIAKEKLKKEEARKRRLEAVDKGIKMIDEMYRTLTKESDRDSRTIEINISCPVEKDQGFFACITMSEDADGLLVMNIHEYRGRGDVILCISTRDVTAGPEDILASIEKQFPSECARWIFEHGDEFCDLALTNLEEQYKRM